MHQYPVSHSTRMVRLLARVPAADLDYLAALLELPHGPAELIETINARLAGRYRPRLPAGPSALVDPADRRRRETLYLMLNDRERYPAIADVLAVVEQTMGIALNLPVSHWLSRRDVLQKTWGRLLALSPEERVARCQRFFEHTARALRPPPDATEWSR